MRKVHMKTTSASPKGVWPVGAIVQIDNNEAEKLVEGGYGSYIDEMPIKTTAEPQERAVLPPARGRKKA